MKKTLLSLGLAGLLTAGCATTSKQVSTKNTEKPAVSDCYNFSYGKITDEDLQKQLANLQRKVKRILPHVFEHGEADFYLMEDHTARVRLNGSNYDFEVNITAPDRIAPHKGIDNNTQKYRPANRVVQYRPEEDTLKITLSNGLEGVNKNQFDFYLGNKGIELNHIFRNMDTPCEKVIEPNHFMQSDMRSLSEALDDVLGTLSREKVARR